MKPQSMTQKILARAAGKASVEAGEIVEADIDMCFTHDPCLEELARDFYREFGADARVWDADKVALFEDHLVPAKDVVSRRLSLAMSNFAQQQGITNHFPYGANYGVCHIVMCEQGLARPGEIVIGTDSHSVTYGAFNSFGTGVGVVDMLNVFRTGRLWFIVPETIQVRLEGQLRPGVQAKDIILKLLGDIGMGGASGKTIEWTGSTIDAMSVEERMTLCNMVVEAGATNGIMALNEATREELARITDRPYEPVVTDSGFEYAQTLEYSAEDIPSMVAFPHRPDNVHSIDEAIARKIELDQVYVGSCTGAKYEDIETVASVVEGQTIASGLQLIVVPSSMSIYRKMSESGVLSTLLEAGAVVESPGCKACFGAHGGILADGEVCLATINRNFRGRMGNPQTSIYLSSPHVAGKSALAGYITN